jgi:WD40 repeat protein
LTRNGLQTIKTHTKFVQDVRYAPSGDHFASVGADAKVFLYDGKNGDVLGELEGDAHKGTVVSVCLQPACPISHRNLQMACSWSADNKHLVTAALDCTVKLCGSEMLRSQEGR